MEAVVRAALLSALGAGVAQGTPVRPGRIASAAALSVFAAILMFASIGCGAAALWISVGAKLGPAGGAIVTAGAFLVAALAVVAVLRRITEPAAPSAQPGPAHGAALVDEIVGLVDANKGVALTAALLAGLAAGRRSP
jgi:hypothetical protein